MKLLKLLVLATTSMLALGGYIPPIKKTDEVKIVDKKKS